MIKIVAKFLEAILSFAVVIIVIGCGIGGFAISQSSNYGTFASIIFSGLGIIAGFIISAITLGIQMLLLQINRNLESINSTILEQSSRNLSSQKLPESFYKVPTKATKAES